LSATVVAVSVIGWPLLAISSANQTADGPPAYHEHAVLNKIGDLNS
jgi:hypothetical protein